MSTGQTWDLIFFRNVGIYFTAAAAGAGAEAWRLAPVEPRGSIGLQTG